MRGLGSATQGGQSQGRTLILLDGVPLNNSATGAVNWNDLAIEDIDRVEVFKGPSSSLYGSNAIGGTINIITKVAKKGYSLDTAYGTYNTFDATAKAGAQAGALAVEVFAKHLQSDGYVQAVKANRNQYTRKSYLNEKSRGAKAAYAEGRKLVTPDFVAWFRDCVRQVEDPRTLNHFRLHFEAMLGFLKAIRG